MLSLCQWGFVKTFEIMSDSILTPNPPKWRDVTYARSAAVMCTKDVFKIKMTPTPIRVFPRFCFSLYTKHPPYVYWVPYLAPGYINF